ncbi:MAG: hypothetical protein ACRDN8_05555, partial [Thermoleophilaceae bacterium]
AERSGSKAAAPPSRAGSSGGARAKSTGTRTKGGARPKSAAGPGSTAASHGGGDPVGEAIRTVTGVAATGARVATGVAREVLRRLPRP